METPADIVNRRFGDVFLSKTENLKVVSGERGEQTGENVTVFSAVLDTGVINPVVLSALVPGNIQVNGANLRDLDWSSVHVRSYNSWDDAIAAGVNLVDTDPQKPVSGALREVKDLRIVAVDQTKDSKVYHFAEADLGRLTVFTAAPTIATGGNDLPLKSTFLPMLSSGNFVYER